MRQWVKAVLLMRIWKSNHRLWLGRLGSAFLNDTLPLHKTKENLPEINRLELRIQPWQRWDIQLADMLQTYLFSCPRKICVDFLCGLRTQLLASGQLRDKAVLFFFLFSEAWPWFIWVIYIYNAEPTWSQLVPVSNITTFKSHRAHRSTQHVFEPIYYLMRASVFEWYQSESVDKDQTARLVFVLSVYSQISAINLTSVL